MTDSPALAQVQYVVEIDNDGCSHCSEGKTWTVVAPDGDAIGESFQNEEDAQSLCDLLNEAFENGVRRASLTTPPRTPDRESLSRTISELVVHRGQILKAMNALVAWIKEHTPNYVIEELATLKPLLREAKRVQEEYPSEPTTPAPQTPEHRHRLSWRNETLAYHCPCGFSVSEKAILGDFDIQQPRGPAPASSQKGER